jgi:ferric-dicitrate binding protein FerR (iron transport regulator)
MNTEAQLEELVAHYIEGKCGPTELKELEALLLDDVLNREYFFEMVLLDQDLGLLNGSGQRRIGSGLLPVELMLQRQRRRTVRVSLLATAAVVLVSAVVLWMQMAPRHAATLARFRTATDSVFVVTHSGDTKKPLGNMLAENSQLVIEHGAVELALPHHVRAVVEGPAALTLLDERTVQLDRGRGFFEVPSKEGRGFTVVTPHQRIVDLGTAFGVDMRPGRDGVELHVFEGRVRVDPLDGGEGGIFTAPRSVELSEAQVRGELSGSSAAFRRELPLKVETLLHEDFESGLVGGGDFDVIIDPTVVRDLAGNPFAGIEEDNPWSFKTARQLTEPAAFHDFGGEPSPGHITTRRFPVNLIQFADGSDTGITLRISGAINIHSGKSGETAPPAEGTPAAALFQGSGINLGDGYLTEREPKESGPTELIFTGMNPGLRYDIALYGDRSGLHSDGKERFTLKSADDASNHSSTGIVSNFVTEMETRRNAAAGHVVRWTGIDPGADGTVNIKIDPSVSGSVNRSYLSAIRVTASTVDGVPVNFNTLPFDSSNYADGDGMPDSFELAHTNPPSPTALDPDEDPDGDGLNNLREFQHGTDPYNPDTDGDGVPDRAELTAGTNPARAPTPGEQEDTQAAGSDDDPPVIVFRYPAEGSSNALPGELMTLTFNEPVKLGTGRIFLRNLADFSESEIAAGGPRTSVNGRVLTIIPPAQLADGEIQPGRISGWECHHGPGIFNPSGEGMWYEHEGLQDSSKSRGMIGSMKGPNMATFGDCLPGSRIRREIGAITPDSRYTVSAAIGVRTEKAGTREVFDGYTIRLVSGETLLAELTDNTPPGPPNSVINVGFSWDSSSLPQGVAAGDPLAIEIAPNQASVDTPGYLDLDNVRVTAVGSGDEGSEPTPVNR